MVAGVHRPAHREDAARNRDPRVFIVALSLRERIAIVGVVSLDKPIAILARSERATFRNSGQVTQLATIPLAHVDEVAIDLVTAILNLALLLLQLFRLPGKPLRGGVDLLDLLLDLRLSALEPGPIVRQRSLHLRDLPLPINELLSEGDHGPAVLVLALTQRLLLLFEPVDIELDTGTQPFQLILTLPDILVDFGKMIAELHASVAQAVEPGADAQLDLGKLFE